MNMSENQKSSYLQPRWKRFSIYGFVLGAAVVLIGLAAWFFMPGTPASPPSLTGGKASEVQVPPRKTQAGKDLSVPPPAAAAAVAAESTATLESQLAQVLTGIREANQKKDLSQLLSHYSPNFPQLQPRVQHISKAWKTYDYPKMDFEITETKLLAKNTAQARVTWNVESKNITTLKIKTIVKTYVIRFGKESSQWRIISLEPEE
jgi:hypothetical protein